MTEINFNLLDDPWIPCKKTSKEFELLSIKDVLFNGVEISEISSNNPLVTASLHRLLLAILHRNFGPSNRDQWIKINKKGKWDPTVLNTYFSKWSDKFNLFGEDRFYQVDISEIVKNRTPITKLDHAISSGNNTSLFDHSWDSDIIAMPINQAAQLLIAFQNFAVGGGVSTPYNYSHAPLVSGVLVLLRGDNLFETLLLNLIRYDGTHPFRISSDYEDLPFWEREDKKLHEEKQGRFPRGYLDLLTWQSRRIWLIPILHDGKILIEHVKLAQGEKLREEWNKDPQMGDPQMVYVMDKDNKKKPIRFQLNKQVWRDVEALLRLNDAKNKTISPIAVNWVSSFAQEGSISLSKRYSLELYGLCNDPTKAAKIISWNRSYIPLPLTYLENPRLIDIIKSFISSCDKIGKALNKTLYFFGKDYLFPGSKSLNPTQKGKLKGLIQSYQLSIRYWNVLENYFYKFMDEIAEESDYGKMQEIMKFYISDQVIQECRNLLDSVKSSLKDDPRAFKSIIQHFGYFFSLIKEI